MCLFGGWWMVDGGWWVVVVVVMVRIVSFIRCLVYFRYCVYSVIDRVLNILAFERFNYGGIKNERVFI